MSFLITLFLLYFEKKLYRLQTKRFADRKHMYIAFLLYVYTSLKTSFFDGKNSEDIPISYRRITITKK